MNYLFVHYRGSSAAEGNATLKLTHPVEEVTRELLENTKKWILENETNIGEKVTITFFALLPA